MGISGEIATKFSRLLLSITISSTPLRNFNCLVLDLKSGASRCAHDPELESRVLSS